MTELSVHEIALKVSQGFEQAEIEYMMTGSLVSGLGPGVPRCMGRPAS
jgi:hypothetical protein